MRKVSSKAGVLWGVRWMLCSILVGGIPGILLALWTVYEERSLADLAKNGLFAALGHPILILILFGGVVGWGLSLIGERMLGTRGATRWLPIGLGLISLVGLFLGVTALFGGSGSGLVRLLVVLAFGGGALAGGGLHQLLGESR